HDDGGAGPRQHLRRYRRGVDLGQLGSHRRRRSRRHRAGGDGLELHRAEKSPAGRKPHHQPARRRHPPALSDHSLPRRRSGGAQRAGGGGHGRTASGTEFRRMIGSGSVMNAIALPALILLLLASALIAVTLGPAQITPGEAWSVILHHLGLLPESPVGHLRDAIVWE